MLDDIIKTKNILPSIILICFVIGLNQYSYQAPWSQTICVIIICSLVLLYTKVSHLIKSLLLVNTVFISCLVLLDFNTIDHDALLANIFILLAFLVGRYFYKIRGRFIFIEVTLLVFLALLFYPPAIFYILFIYSLMLFHSIKRFSTWLLPLYCITMFTAIAFGISFLVDFNFLDYSKDQFLHFQLVYYQFNMQQLYLLLSLILLGIFALIDHFRVTFKQSIDNKKNYELVLYFLIISCLLFFLSKNALLFILFPCSVIISKYIYYQKNKWVKWLMILYFPISALVWSVI